MIQSLRSITSKINKSTEEKIINVLIFLTTILISIIVYFSTIGCYEFDSNICLIENPESIIKYNITLPYNKFLAPFQEFELWDKIKQFFNYKYPYFWLMLGIVISALIIYFRPNIVDKNDDN